MIVRLLLLFAWAEQTTTVPTGEQCDESALIQASKSCTTGGCQFDTFEMYRAGKVYRAGKTFCIEVEKCIEVAK